jgi:hypothetical protein
MMISYVSASVYSFGKKEQKKTEAQSVKNNQSETYTIEETPVDIADGEFISVTGRVRLVGNEPFIEFVISDSAQNDFYIERRGEALLLPYQQETVTVEGYLFVYEQMLANGRRIADKKVLRAIKLVTVPHS